MLFQQRQKDHQLEKVLEISTKFDWSVISITHVTLTLTLQSKLIIPQTPSPKPTYNNTILYLCIQNMNLLT